MCGAHHIHCDLWSKKDTTTFDDHRMLSKMMSETDDPNAVLAFILGSHPSPQSLEIADTPTPSEQQNNPIQEEEELPELEPVQEDIDTESEAASEAIQSELQRHQPTTRTREMSSVKTEKKQVPGDNCKEIPSSRISIPGPNTSSKEAEHEDDCAVKFTNSNSQLSLQKTKLAGKKYPKSGNEKPKMLTKRGRSTETHTETSSVVSKLKPRKDQTKREEKQATLEEFLFVGCVATVLVAYLVACVYSFFHPVAVPLPDYEAFYSAYNISNVTVEIMNPVSNSQITPQGVKFEWKIANFPVEALYQYGAEVFQYRVSINDDEITSEIGFLALDEGRNGPTDNALNHTVQFPIPLRKFTGLDDVSFDAKQFKLHLEVTIPIPGLIGELTTFEQTVYVWKPAAPRAREMTTFEFTAPEDGATFEEGQSIVLEYTAVNVHEMYVFVDERSHLKKTHVSDGNLLLRELGVGLHTFEVRALDERGKAAAPSTLHVKIIERQNVETP